MSLVLLVLILALLFGGLGFALHWLWIFAVVLALFWLAAIGSAHVGTPVPDGTSLPCSS
mgnify:CR=1 FL=1